MVDSRFETNYVADTMAFVANRSADLADGVDEFNTQHPLGRGKLYLTSKVMDVLDERAQDDTSTLGSLGSHCIDDIGSEVRIESGVGRHFGGV